MGTSVKNTFPETNSKPLRNGAWEMTVILGYGLFSGVNLLSVLGTVILADTSR